MTHTEIPGDAAGDPGAPSAIETTATGDGKVSMTTSTPVAMLDGHTKEKTTSFMGWTLVLTVTLVGSITVLSFFYQPAQWDLVSKVIDNCDRWIMFLLGVISGATMPTGRK